MNFFFYLSASISDFVSRLETNEILGFVGGEDMEQGSDVMWVSPLALFPLVFKRFSMINPVCDAGRRNPANRG